MAYTYPRTKADLEAQDIMLNLGYNVDDFAEIRIVPGDQAFERHVETVILFKEQLPWGPPIKEGREVITVGYNRLKKAAPELLRHLLKLKLTWR